MSIERETKIVDAIVAEEERAGRWMPYGRIVELARAVEMALSVSEKPVIKAGESVYLIGQRVYDRLDRHHDAIIQLQNMMRDVANLGAPSAQSYTPLGERGGTT